MHYLLQAAELLNRQVDHIISIQVENILKLHCYALKCISPPNVHGTDIMSAI